MTKNIPANIYKRRDGLTARKYAALYQESIQNPEKFWEKQASLIDFFSPWKSVFSGDWTKGKAKWFDKGRLNACYNCVDRHIESHGDDIALIWQGENTDETLKISYKTLHQKVNRCANILKKYGVKPGDVVGIYLPMIPEAIISMLACARIGAIHCVIFAGFSAEALSRRLNETNCQLVITADQGIRGGKFIHLKKQVDEALENSPQVKHVIIVRRTGNQIPLKRPRDVFYDKAERMVDAHCDYVEVESEDPLFILYTSGSTGKPKGILHTTAGYLLYTALTFKTVFDYQPGDVYWCTADVGWITGHSYSVYGPLANRATVLIYEGIPTYPDAGRFWQVIDQHQVNIFYTAPTAIRALMREGDEWIQKSKRDSLRILGTVGEPINPSVWEWYFNVVGNAKCPIIDTWWQTETGGFLITPVAGITPLKPGSATKPFWGIQPSLTEKDKGNLIITAPWPALMRTVYKDQTRFIKSYLSPVKNAYFTGDGAKCDKNGNYYITGRIDDVINTSGHRLSTAEIESALVGHHHIAEAAVVGYPHDIKGEGVYAFVTPKAEVTLTEDLKKDLINRVSKVIGSIAKPDIVHFTQALPKTRSGKIMRRILRKIAAGETKDFGDISTLADPKIVEELLKKSHKHS